MKAKQDHFRQAAKVTVPHRDGKDRPFHKTRSITTANGKIVDATLDCIIRLLRKGLV